MDNSVTLPPSTDPIWVDIITGKKNYIFQCLAIQITLMRLTVSVQYDLSVEHLEKCANELRTVLEKNSAQPSARRDIQKLFALPVGGA